MSNIDKQAQYESKFSRLWERYDEASHGNAEQMRDILEVTLDALESAERKILMLEKLAEAESVGADKAAASGVEWMKRCMAAEKRIAELEGGAFNPAILDVVAERQRQKTIEGWTPEHDDEHCNGELAMAAICYINETGTVNRNGGKPWGWPWDASWWKPNARRRNLVKAGALILAEIERIDRAAGIGKGE
ncbi:ead/Ea22-like family protein [Enterobacter kobei]|uniref:ead/Ea22-like family protein n=1 Tax=Enterobacter kobei TaxID=208224 RepID=UPI0018F56AD8|nr:ead/Ea22-like family protein [Enterobacter kobei]